jgi:hypothetical protein
MSVFTIGINFQFTVVYIQASGPAALSFSATEGVESNDKCQ